jgi:arylsulfatase A-like enzyme
VKNVARQSVHRILITALGILAGLQVAQAAPYNVLFIAVDDLRPELGCYGHPTIKSPNIDKLASQGLRFDRAYCQLALCNPSRSSLLTGLRPETLGIYDLATNIRDRLPDVVTLPQLFKNNGYTSVRFGKIFHTTNGNHDDNVSWSEVPGSVAAKAPANASSETTTKKKKKGKAGTSTDPHANELPYAAPDCTDEALADGKVAADAIAAMRLLTNKPFFLAVGFHKPHLPFVAPKRYWDFYDAASLKLAPNPYLPKDTPEFASNDASELRRYKGVPKQGPISDTEARNLIHGYYACVSYTDAQVGKVLAELDRLGLRKNTIVILWGDHGYHLGEHGTWNKRTNWEIATRVPMIIALPNQKTAGQATAALVEFVDIYPTLAGLCKLRTPQNLEGTSFQPLIESPQRPWKTAAFSIYQKNIPDVGNAFARAIRTADYRMVEWSTTNSTFKAYELYDHRKDHDENVNIAKLPENKQTLEGLIQQLHVGWRKAVPPLR